ncbi:hypothetical protein Anapl_01786 [Anas platyrhynchos]|uniref:Uncharacterized protein n=1 Tax=Anas platyrhynchos TaxID=8839 RepID=R0K199_ANAPL|nr:hypothetical protein Anapl_01786 [Anas platyrhynchos]
MKTLLIHSQKTKPSKHSMQEMTGTQYAANQTSMYPMVTHDAEQHPQGSPGGTLRDSSDEEGRPEAWAGCPLSSGCNCQGLFIAFRHTSALVHIKRLNAAQRGKMVDQSHTNCTVTYSHNRQSPLPSWSQLCPERWHESLPEIGISFQNLNTKQRHGNVLVSRYKACHILLLVKRLSIIFSQLKENA